MFDKYNNYYDLYIKILKNNSKSIINNIILVLKKYFTNINDKKIIVSDNVIKYDHNEEIIIDDNCDGMEEVFCALCLCVRNCDIKASIVGSNTSGLPIDPEFRLIYQNNIIKLEEGPKVLVLMYGESDSEGTELLPVLDNKVRLHTEEDFKRFTYVDYNNKCYSKKEYDKSFEVIKKININRIIDKTPKNKSDFLKTLKKDIDSFLLFFELTDEQLDDYDFLIDILKNNRYYFDNRVIGRLSDKHLDNADFLIKLLNNDNGLFYLKIMPKIVVKDIELFNECVKNGIGPIDDIKVSDEIKNSNEYKEACERERLELQELNDRYTIKYRDINYSDFNFIYDLDEKNLKPYFKNWETSKRKEALKRELTIAKDNYKIIIYDYKDVGVMLFFNHVDYNQIVFIHIDSKYHGKGIEKYIILEFLAKASREKKDLVGVAPKDSYLSEIYEELGFDKFNENIGFLYYRL